MPARELTELASRVADLERRFSGVMRHGTVHEVDPAKQIVRLKMGDGEDGGPFLSPWLPYAQIAGALKVHTPPSAGQQMTILSPSGDWLQGTALPFTWSNGNPSPSSSGSEHVLTFGDVKITIEGSKVTVEAPEVLVQASDKITLDAEKIVLKSDDIHLGEEGGPKVARVGDKTSDGARIIEGSEKVRSA